MTAKDNEEERPRSAALRNAQGILPPRFHAEDSLRQQTEWLRVTLASIGDAVISTDSRGRVTFMNRVAEELTGWTRDEAIGRPLSDVFHIVHEQTRHPAANPVMPALREGTTVSLANHTVLITRDGSERAIDDCASPMRDADGALLGAVLVFRDVSENKRAAEAKARLAAIVESSDDAIISKTLDGIIRSWNQGAERIFGYSAGEAVGRHITLIIPPERHDEERTILERLRRGERIDHFETVRAAKDGRLLDISLTVSPIRDESGEVIGASKIARDITERKRAEEALRQADRRKDEFLAILAHELRNPLAPLRNGLQVMRLAVGDPDAVEQARAMMERQLGHMVRLIDDLLDISRISRDKMELRRARVALADVVRAAEEAVWPLLDEAGLELSISLPPEPLYLDADLTRLAQVVGNLLSNCAKYTERGGRVWLTVHKDRDEAVLAVRDTGIGIPAAALPNIFDMFSQVDRTIERSTGGLGIGLALVKGLVEMHGGTVAAESPGPGQGSTFTVRLPHLECFTPSILPPESMERGGETSRRILVVDDNRDSATSMSLMLGLRGDEVRIAHDGLEAVALAESFRPQVILMDVGMPRLNGYEATRRIRALPWGRAPVIVALTGWGQEDDRQRSRDAGCDGHLVKPVSLADLESLLARLIPSQ